MKSKTKEKPTAKTFAISKGKTIDSEIFKGSRPYKLVNGKRSPRGAFQLPAFTSGVRFISESISGLPKRINQKVVGDIKRGVDHYLTNLVFEEPNPYVNGLYLWEYAVSQAVVFGNGYILIQRRAGKVKGLFNLESALVVPRREDGVQYYYVRNLDGSLLKDEDGSTVRFHSSDIIHIRNFSTDGEVGLSILDEMASTFGIAQSIDTFLETFFENGSAVNLVIESKDALNKESIDTLRYGIEENNKGLDNAHNLMVLSGATAKNLTGPLKDFAYEILKPMTVDDIARMLRIPPHTLYQLAGSNYSSIEALGTELGKFGFNAWVQKIELELKIKLLTKEEREAGLYFQFDLNGLMRGDYKTRRDTLRLDFAAGLISWEQWQAFEDQSTVRQGTYVLPANTSEAVFEAGELVSVRNYHTETPAETAVVDDPTPAPELPDAAESTGEALEAIPEPPAEVARPAPADTFKRFLDDAGARVKAKQTKAFANHADWDGERLQNWMKRFASEQGLFLGEALNPFLETIYEDKIKLPFALQDVCESYEALVLANGEKAEPNEVIDKLIGGLQ